MRCIWLINPVRDIHALSMNKRQQMSICPWLRSQFSKTTFKPGNVAIWHRAEAFKQNFQTMSKPEFPVSTWPHFSPKYKSICVRIGQRVCLITLSSTASIFYQWWKIKCMSKLLKRWWGEWKSFHETMWKMKKALFDHSS